MTQTIEQLTARVRELEEQRDELNRSANLTKRLCIEMKEYNEHVVETLDDAGCIIANKNIIIDNLQARIAELEGDVAIERASRKYWEDAYSEWINTDKAAQGLIAKDERIAELEEEIERLRADNIAFARNLKGKSATTGATYEHICTKLADAQEEILIERSNGDHWRAAYSKWVNTDESARRLIELQDQLAKAEQRVAEACALQVATETKFHWLDAARVAKEIRSGEWRKFVKEV